MARGDDSSSAHFDWLVAGRSRNQQTTLDLYKLIEANEDLLADNIVLHEDVYQLVGIAFSLWRAVFLSDLTRDPTNQLADAKTFLRSLIAHNAVLYQTDFNAREWTFAYYLDNALARLKGLSPKILPDEQRPLEAASAKDEWTNAQAALNIATLNFAEIIGGYATD